RVPAQRQARPGGERHEPPCDHHLRRRPRLHLHERARAEDHRQEGAQSDADPGRFDLLVGATVVKAAAGDGGKGSTRVQPGPYTVGEAGANGTDLSSYTSSIACTKNGSPDVSGPGTSIGVTVALHDSETCTITNVHR